MTTNEDGRRTPEAPTACYCPDGAPEPMCGYCTGEDRDAPPGVLYRRVDTGIGIGHEPVGGAILAMREAADAVHKIAGALYARGRLGDPKTLTPVMRASFESKLMTDYEIRLLALDTFKQLVTALHAAGAEGVTVHECGEGDITP